MDWESKWLITLLIVAVIAGGFMLDNVLTYEPDPVEVAEYKMEYCQPLEVERVIDGDTLISARGETLRLGGIDTPERGEKGARAATAALERYVREELCYVATDIGYYGRTIAWIYTVEGGVSVNERLLREGYAEVYE